MLARSPWIAALVSAMVVGIGCTKRSEPVKPTTLDTQRAASVAAGPTAPPVPSVSADAAPPEPPTAWTDPRVVAELARDCDYLPPERPSDGPNVPADLFRCTPEVEQSCAYDPCSADEADCKDEYGKTCRACGGACSTSCNTCKATCTDDTCKHACATSCAACKQECTRTMDRGTSGACTAKAVACAKRVGALYAANHCETACAAHRDCMNGCKGSDEAARRCAEACLARTNTRANDCLGRCKGKSCYHDCFFTSGCSLDMCNVGPERAGR